MGKSVVDVTRRSAGGRGKRDHGPVCCHSGFDLNEAGNGRISGPQRYWNAGPVCQNGGEMSSSEIKTADLQAWAGRNAPPKAPLDLVRLLN